MGAQPKGKCQQITLLEWASSARIIALVLGLYLPIHGEVSKDSKTRASLKILEIAIEQYNQS
jgi:hypothetical protein